MTEEERIYLHRLLVTILDDQPRFANQAARPPIDEQMKKDVIGALAADAKLLRHQAEERLKSIQAAA